MTASQDLFERLTAERLMCNAHNVWDVMLA